MASSTINEFTHLQIPLEDVVKATNNFHHDNIIGHGGLGTAYKGRLLRSGKLMKIGALRLDHKHGERDMEFWTEISVLSDLKHTNLVSLIGFCDEQDEKIIITTYQAKGSLKEHLNSSNLTWTQRLKICVGVARALSYLHYGEERGYGIIHRNINSCTILLDENWEAKLSGFKVSIKQSVNRMDEVFLSEPIGTLGYMDPEIEKTNGVTHKSDIYAFGVVLFEILCGRKAFLLNDVNMFLAPLAKDHYENKTLEDIIHPNIRNEMSRRSLVKYSKAAYSCLKEDRAHRPNMDYVVTKLEKALEFQLLREDFENKFEHLRISLTDLKLETDNFSEAYKVGSSSYYNFYKAKRDYSDKENPSSGEPPKRHITGVIKRVLSGNDIYQEEYFFRELEILTCVNHCGIVTLHGFCVEGREMILVIDNFSNGYLDQHLVNVNDKHILTWEKRLKICIDVAHALNYLHYEMDDQKVIINRDISSYDIGLDENLRAKIVDFGLSLFLPPNQEDETLYPKKIVGTPFYIDPAYEKTTKLKRESDVYSFGVVLFEILCGRLAYDPIYLNDTDKGLAYVARRKFRMGTVNEMVDPIIKEENSENTYILNRGPNKDSLETFINIAYKCVEEIQNQRPTMKVVIKELERALFFQDDREQRPDNVQVGNEPEKSLKLQLTHGNISGKKFEHLKIPLSDIKIATANFSLTYEIGSDAYSTLYRAELHLFSKENPPSVVVIKRYHSGYEVFDEEAFTEIEMLTSLKHPNIVTLFGFCVEDSEMILIIENSFNRFIGDCLGNNNYVNRRILTWEKRLKICIDVAHALNYLHCEMEDQTMIINRNISSPNIWLDEKWEAKIANFRLSLSVPPNQEDKALYLKSYSGTKYYIDPEYKKTGRLKIESDIYSFGVVLFEILCGRIAGDPIYLTETDEGIAYVARQSLCMRKIEEMIDPIMKEEAGESNFVLNRGPNKDSLDTFTKIAYQCVAKTQDQRPTMKVVIEELEKALFFQKNNKDNPRISIEDINQATQNFHKDNCIGGGGFGRVYKGNLLNRDGLKTIVAKRLDTRLGQGEQQFLSELQILLEYKHENVIGLVGYCDEKDEKIIVYEYEPRGSLDMYLNNASLTWVKRLNICIDVASALDFLHGGVGKKAKVIHRDIKSANILLNHDWKAKLADYGLSLISPIIQETDYVIDRACGTLGYLDPLYRKTGFLTIESDIYSFGVVLFEILCGISTYSIHKREGHYLPDFIKNIFEEGRQDEVVFEKIKEQIVPESLIAFQEIAYQCLQHEREKRPTTKEVLSQLKKALEFQISRDD